MFGSALFVDALTPLVVPGTVMVCFASMSAHLMAADGDPAIDPVIVPAVFCLLLIGLVMVTSASLNVAERLSGDQFFHFERQLLSVLLGCPFAGAMLFVPIAIWQRLAPVLLVASFALLVPWC